MDLLDQLITDIISVTEGLMKSDPFDLSAFQPGATSVEKLHQSQGTDAKNRQAKQRNPMTEGIHRGVC